VTLSLFAGLDGDPNQHTLARYETGLSQIVESLPHIARRMDIHVAVFTDSQMLEKLKTLKHHPHVTFVPIERQGMAGMLDRLRWHDPEALRKEGMLKTGLSEIPDVVTTWDADSLLDSPAFDWWIQHALHQPEFIHAMQGVGSSGPNNIGRVIDAGSFAVTPKTMPANFTWPQSGSTPGTLRNFFHHFMQGKKNGYGVDEEALSDMLNSLLARDQGGVRVLGRSITDLFIGATLNTGEDCQKEGDIQYDIWLSP